MSYTYTHSPLKLNIIVVSQRRKKSSTLWGGKILNDKRTSVNSYSRVSPRNPALPISRKLSPKDLPFSA